MAYEVGTAMGIGGSIMMSGGSSMRLTGGRIHVVSGKSNSLLSGGVSIYTGNGHSGGQSGGMKLSSGNSIEGMGAINVIAGMSSVGNGGSVMLQGSAGASIVINSGISDTATGGSVHAED